MFSRLPASLYVPQFSAALRYMAAHTFGKTAEECDESPIPNAQDLNNLLMLGFPHDDGDDSAYQGIIRFYAFDGSNRYSMQIFTAQPVDTFTALISAEDALWIANAPSHIEFRSVSDHNEVVVTRDTSTITNNLSSEPIYKAFPATFGALPRRAYQSPLIQSGAFTTKDRNVSVIPSGGVCIQHFGDGMRFMEVATKGMDHPAAIMAGTASGSISMAYGQDSDDNNPHEIYYHAYVHPTQDHAIDQDDMGILMGGWG